MNGPTAFAANFRTAVATAALMVLGGVLIAQTMTTRGSGSTQKLTGICMLVLPGKVTIREGTPMISTQKAELVIDAKVWWQSPSSGNNPSVTYDIRLGITNRSASDWRTPVRFVLTDVRGSWHPAEPVIAPLTTPSLSRPGAQVVSPSQLTLDSPNGVLIPSNQTGMASSSVQRTVVWRERPGLMIDAFDNNPTNPKHLGSCYLNEMTAVRPPNLQGGVAEGVAPEPSPPAPPTRPAPVPGQPVPRAGGTLQ